MRLHHLLTVAVALAFSTAPAAAQRPRPLSDAQRDTAQGWLRALERDPSAISLPEPGRIQVGAVTVPAGARTDGDVATFRGTLDVLGTVEGDAIALGGDVILRPGSVVRGNVASVGGRVRPEGGTVEGELITLSLSSTRRAYTAAQLTRRAMSLATGWFVVLLAVGVAVLVLARSNLERVADAVRARFTRSLVIGLVGQLALLPVLLLGMVVLTVTILGILLVPFVAVAYVTAAAGALALGFVAMSYVAGEALGRRWGGAGPSALPGLVVMVLGLLLFYGVWLLAAGFAWAGALGAVLRYAAAILTWVAVTVGFGATIATRGGTRDVTHGPAAVPPTDEYAWQTPTPVTGVTAARRPTPVSTSREL